MPDRRDSITLSHQHGVNPSVLCCFICGAETGVALMGRLPADAEAPRHTTTPHEHCDACALQMQTHIALLVAAPDTGARTGQFAFIRDGAFLPGIADEALRETIRRARMTYIDPQLWEQVVAIHRQQEAAPDAPTTGT